MRTQRSLFRRYLSILAQDAGYDDAIIGHVGRFGQYRLSFHAGTAAIMAETPRMCCAKTSGQILYRIFARALPNVRIWRELGPAVRSAIRSLWDG